MSNEITNLEDWSFIWLENGKRAITHQRTHARDVKLIVETMAQVVQTKVRLFYTETQANRTIARATPLGVRFLRCLKADTQAIHRQYPQHRFSPLYIIFKRHTSAIRYEYEKLHPGTVEYLNNAVSKIRRLARGTAVPKRLDNLKRAERDNARRAKDLLTDLRKHYSKLVVIRIDLEYFSEYGPGGFHGQGIDLKVAQEHRDQFLDYLRRGPFEYCMAGYVWKLEWGFEKGHHLHFAIFLDGQKVRQDIVIADALGDHWKIITEGKGMFYNCNKAKEKYQECGIGTILRSDDGSWETLKKVVRYLTKVDYYVRFQVRDRSRTFGAGGVYPPNPRQNRVRQTISPS
ncbi:inovirus-type Gp2 protein [Rhodanobacter sp. IGA1.0]|uniref:Inovirus-type Gp2 protein n=1 Tax=Rhodanobacter sp. IGA1.0 TaxID=3158582 RepID=A0AAU7QJU0_9GAMM